MHRILSSFRLLLLLCVLPLYLQAAPHYLRDDLIKANPGDFLVSLQGKLYTLMHIHSRDGERLVIEEISIPKRFVSKGAFSWREWIQEGAPKHSAWSLYEIDLQTARMLEYYSVSQKAWGELGEGENLLSTLLSLRLEPVRPGDRKRIGPAPIAGQMDRRRLWQPQLFVDGELVRGVQFDAWRTYWPRDGSELSGKMIDLYLAKGRNAPLAFFPAWIEVAGAVGRAQLRIIDSGAGLKSPQSHLPRRPPSIVSYTEQEGQLSITVATRPYYKGFTLYAVRKQGGQRQFVELGHEMQLFDEHTELELIVDTAEIEQKLGTEGPVHFALQPHGHPEAMSESHEPWIRRSSR